MEITELIPAPSAIFEEAYQVSQSMQKWGGSFVKQLGVLISHADPLNLARIKSTFPEYWNYYLGQANRNSVRKPHGMQEENNNGKKTGRIGIDKP